MVLLSTQNICFGLEIRKLFFFLVHTHNWESSSSVVECLTWDWGASIASLCCGPWARHIYPSLVLVQLRNTCPCLTERLLMGCKESNQTNKALLTEVLNLDDMVKALGEYFPYYSTVKKGPGRCLYPCEIILFHWSFTSFNVKITSPCRISPYSGFFGSLFHVSCGEQEKEPIIRVRVG